jgi:hypothetical protein
VYIAEDQKNAVFGPKALDEEVANSDGLGWIWRRGGSFMGQSGNSSHGSTVCAKCVQGTVARDPEQPGLGIGDVPSKSSSVFPRCEKSLLEQVVS